MLEMQKNNLSLSQGFQENVLSFSVDGDVIVPDSKPDVANILFIDCIPSVENEAVNSGQLTLSGFCEFNIIYSSDEDNAQIMRISTSIPFKNSFDVPGITPDSIFNVIIIPDELKSSIINGRKINISADLTCKVTSFSINEIEFVEAFSPNESIHTQKMHQKIHMCPVNEKVVTVVRDTSIIPISLPDIKDIIKYETRISNEEAVISDDKIIFKGDLFIKTYYTCDSENKIYSFDVTLPFSNSANVKNIEQNAVVTLKSKVNSLALKVMPDSDGLMRIVEFDALICSLTLVSFDKDIELISDMYDTEKKLEIEKENIQYQKIALSSSEDATLRGIINVPESETISIVSVIARPKNFSLSSTDNKNILAGNIEVILVYTVLSSNKINSVSVNMPMEHMLNSAINNISDISITNTDITQTEPGKFDVKFTLTVSGNNISDESITLIKTVAETDTPSNKTGGITVYYTKPNDSYWEIAKKFNTTVDKIQKTNNISSDSEPSIGTALII